MSSESSVKHIKSFANEIIKYRRMINRKSFFIESLAKEWLFEPKSSSQYIELFINEITK